MFNSIKNSFPDAELIDVKIKSKGENKKYDCLVGISGGVDSCYTAYLCKKWDLKPLLIHMDNGWNSEIAVKNIKKIVDKYNNKNISTNLSSEILINGRKNLIKRCINNLIDNAIKYGDKVIVDLTRGNNNLFIKIEDNGPGIPINEYENVFKPFSLKTHIQLDHPPSPCASNLFNAEIKSP